MRKINLFLAVILVLIISGCVTGSKTVKPSSSEAVKHAPIIEEKKADLISMSRPFIREPDLIDKLRTGRATKSECISCNQCWHPDGIRCTQISKQPQ